MGQEDPLEKEMATHSSVFAWRIPWTEEPGGLWSKGCKELYTTEQLIHIDHRTKVSKSLPKGCIFYLKKGVERFKRSHMALVRIRNYDTGINPKHGSYCHFPRSIV